MLTANRVRALSRSLLLLIATLQAWLFRNEIGPDGIVYLDLSDAVLRRDVGGLVNAYWSPVYPVLIGVVRAIVAPTPLGAVEWEFALVHLANLLGFLASLAAFEWLLRAVDEVGDDWGQRALRSPAGVAAAYALFGVSTLDMISVKGPVPDLLLAAAVFGSFACALRLTRAPGRRSTALALGAMLAVGALSKSILFPLGVVLLAAVGWAIRRHGRASIAMAAAAFALLTLPWIAALSISTGRLSTGETGSLNYAWYVNGKQPPNTGVMPALAAPRDSLPLDGLAVLPDAHGTNPLWYDPARWHRDVRPAFSPSQQWPRLVHSARYYAYVLAPFVLIFISISAASRWPDLRQAWDRTYVVLAPCLAAVAAYSLVYTTSRYIAPFLAAGCVAVGAAFARGAPLRTPPLLVSMPITLLTLAAVSPFRGRIWLAAGVATIVMGWALTRRDDSPDRPHRLRRLFAAAVIVAAMVPGLLQGAAALRAPRGDPHPHWTTAQRLMSGIPAGSRIAVMGNPDNAGWARLARYQIVAVIPPERVDAFKELPEAARAVIVQAFQRAGAVQLVDISP